MKRKRKNSQKNKKKAETVADGAKVQGWTAWLNGNFVEVADENGQKKKSGTLVLALRFIVGLVAWSPANLAFLFDFDQSCNPKN